MVDRPGREAIATTVLIIIILNVQVQDYQTLIDSTNITVKGAPEARNWEKFSD